MDYQSTVAIESQTCAGVRFTIKKLSFGRRMELVRAVRETAHALEFLEAGNEPKDKLEAALVAAEVDELYLKWGLESVEGLVIDGKEATADLLIGRAPENLFREVVGAIKSECFLTDAERKN